MVEGGMEEIDREMQARIEAEHRRLDGDESGVGTAFDDEKIRSVEELRAILKKFRRAMGKAGYPGTMKAQNRQTGWIIASGTVEGYGENVFHVFMLNSGPIYYFSGDPVPPIEFTGKWFLGDSIPTLEAKIPARVAELMARFDVEWPPSPTF